VWCHTSEFTRVFLLSGIHTMLRVHHFGYPPVSFWIPRLRRTDSRATRALRRTSRSATAIFFCDEIE
jgi:hypothetical protein